MSWDIEAIKVLERMVISETGNHDVNAMMHVLQAMSRMLSEMNGQEIQNFVAALRGYEQANKIEDKKENID